SVPRDQSASTGISPGPFLAAADGYVRVSLKGAYQFAWEGRGRVRLRINDHEVASGQDDDLRNLPRRTVVLRQGLNHIELEYESPLADTAAVRLLWSGPDFDFEPIPPAMWLYDVNDPELLHWQSLRQGRELYADLRCWACHGDRGERLLEIGRAGPSLVDVAERLDRNWIAAWLAEPAQLHGDRTMPELLVGSLEQRRQQAVDLAAFLTSGQSNDALQGTLNGVTERNARRESEGRELFERVGCIACHFVGEPPESNSVTDRIRLDHVTWKFKANGLSDFLRQPDRNYTFTRMPDLKLTAEETAALVAYLDKVAVRQFPDWTRQYVANATEGQRLWLNYRCGACHQLLDGADGASLDHDVTTQRIFSAAIVARQSSPDTTDWAGCLSSSIDETQQVPRYDLSPVERTALTRYLMTRANQGATDSAHEAATRQMKRYRCQACHDRDGERGKWRGIVADEGDGRSLEPLPSLTWTGEKLRRDWLEEYLRGDNSPQLRNWLLPARMPRFKAIAGALADGLAQQHGVLNAQEVEFVDRDDYDAFVAKQQQVKLGRELTTAANLDCRQCHGFGDLLPRGDQRTQIAFGVNMAETRKRLRYDYYRRFVLNPTRYEVGTKMPQLSVEGKTKVLHILGGDGVQQFDAIWQYIQHSF
ncbi:MAG: c-type cytochrome, partial [Planctomycetales bacterium]|nr:c-type cytochrome [Planctomycetales bacterium]